MKRVSFLICTGIVIFILNLSVALGGDSMDLHRDLFHKSRYHHKFKPKKAHHMGHSYILHGVLISSEPMAIINKKIVKVGDRIDEFIVTIIDEDGVTLSNRDGEIKIHLK